MKRDFGYREIPYNYTSFSDREIILKYFDQATWDLLNHLRSQRKTGRSARLIFEIIGDIFIIDRNPYIFNDFLNDTKKQKRLKKLHKIRFEAIERKTTNEKIFELLEKLKAVDNLFFNKFKTEKKKRTRIFFSLSQILSKDAIHF
jgi:hypothetical protein